MVHPTVLIQANKAHINAIHAERARYRLASRATNKHTKKLSVMKLMRKLPRVQVMFRIRFVYKPQCV